VTRRQNGDVIATMQDLLVLTRADVERLPDEGRWEVVEGWAILVPPWKYRIKRSKISDATRSITA
jgi:hypothetical protein